VTVGLRSNEVRIVGSCGNILFARAGTEDAICLRWSAIIFRPPSSVRSSPDFAEGILARRRRASAMPGVRSKNAMRRSKLLLAPPCPGEFFAGTKATRPCLEHFVRS
jgi:hypothetical protein